MACRVRTINDGSQYDNFFRADGVNVAYGKFDIKIVYEYRAGKINIREEFLRQKFLRGIHID